MRRVLLLSVLLTALCAPGAFAQIEVNPSGSVKASGSLGVRHIPTGHIAIHATCLADCTRTYDNRYTYGYGAYVRASEKSRNRAIYGYAFTGGSNPNRIVKNYGLFGRAKGEGTQNFGIYARAEGASNVGYGIYAEAYGAAENYAGYFDGDVHVTGTLTEASDAMFKRDVEALGEEDGGGNAPTMQTTTNNSFLQRDGGTRQSSPDGGEGPPPRSQAREQLLGLRPVKYHFRRGAYEEMGFPEGEQYGLVAQEVEAVLPELVTESVHPGAEEIGEDGEPVQTGEPLRYKSVNYLGLVPLLVQTVKEQQAENDALRAEVGTLGQEMETLRDRLERLEGDD